MYPDAVRASLEIDDRVADDIGGGVEDKDIGARAAGEPVAPKPRLGIISVALQDRER
ncbi:MAG: hypothetical protein GDA40_08445 [Rhodobacteraceae bacterium]|nr:hypothetical protein [Paracoccaceae bacterium]